MNDDGPVVTIDVNAVRLQNAVLCPNCETISDSPHDACMICGSRSLLPLSRVLGEMRPVAVPTVPTTAIKRPSSVPDNLLVLTSPPHRPRQRRHKGTLRHG